MATRMGDALMHPLCINTDNGGGGGSSIDAPSLHRCTHPLHHPIMSTNDEG